MQSSIYLLIALVAFSAAQQLNAGPKVQKESDLSSKSPNKRYATREVILYLTPSEIRSLQAAKSAESKESIAENQKEQQLSVQDYNDEQQQKAWLQYFKSLESEQPREQLQEAYYSKSKPVFENQNESGDAYNFYSEQIVKEQQQRIKSQQEREREESQWIQFNRESAKKQEEALLQEQLEQHWNRILNHNRAQLKGLSTIRNEKSKSEASNENERPVIQWQSVSRNQEEQKSKIQKEIESILREASNAEKQGVASEAERYNQQRPPIVIHKEVRITKHQPFPVVEKVNVPVPRPVLVPVPEPYEVKVPHPYPIYLAIALVALCATKQLESGPKIQKGPAPSIRPSKSPNKRYATQEQYFKTLESEQNQNREQLQDSKSKPIFENQNESGGAYDFYSEQNDKEHQQRIKSQQEREREDSQWIQFNPEFAKKQEEALLQEQLQQHWNILNNKAQLAQLRGLSVIISENQKPEASNENERSEIQWQSVSRNQEEQKSDIQKEIENIIREASNVEKQGFTSEAERYNQQRPPVLIHKEIRITKHHPVPVLERVKVSVPRSVLIPVPEPYEVKVPHPYPVPLEIVKHIPIPVISNKYE
ncbi:unnamed protein product, partial [Brenthis ino]